MKNTLFLIIGGLFIVSGFFTVCSGSNTPTTITTPPGGAVTIEGDLWVGGMITINTSQLDGESIIEYYLDVIGAGDEVISGGTRWQRDNPQFPILESHHGNRFRVRVQRDEWEIDEFMASEITAPVVWGYRVDTIASFLPHATAPGNKDQKFDTGGDYWGLEIGANGMLYLACNIAYVGSRIIEINPNEYDDVWGQYKVRDFSGDIPGGLRGSIAVGPNDSVYASIVWGKDRDDGHYVVGYDQPGQNGLAWGSGNIFAKLNALPSPAETWDAANGLNLGPLVVDSEGTIFMVIDQWANRRVLIRISQDGTVSRITGGTTGTAFFNQTLGEMTIGPDGFIYLPDGWNDGAIRRIDPQTGVFTNFMGGQGWSHPFYLMSAITFGKDGNYYLIDKVGDDWEPVIRKITQDKEVSTIAGNPDSSTPGLVDGLARVNAKFNRPMGIAAAADGTVYVADAQNPIIFIRRISFDNT